MSDPHTISLAQLADLLDGLGLSRDIRDIREILIEPQKATVVRMRRNENGNHYVVGDDVATETVTIRIDMSAPCPDHRPAQHRDHKPPWCGRCGRDAAGLMVGRPKVQTLP